MTRYFTQQDVNTQALENNKITVVGYGSQGRAHALNLRDSGHDVTVALRTGGKSWTKATEDGFKPQEVASAVREADVVMVLVPDMNQPALFKNVLNTNLKDDVFFFSHMVLRSITIVFSCPTTGTLPSSLPKVRVLW